MIKMNEEVNQKNITCSNTYNNVDYVTIETLLGDAMTYEEYINSLNKRNLVSVERLQNNWNELKKSLKTRIEFFKDLDKDLLLTSYKKEIEALEVTLKHMQELEQEKEC